MKKILCIFDKSHRKYVYQIYSTCDEKVKQGFGGFVTIYQVNIPSTTIVEQVKLYPSLINVKLQWKNKKMFL